MSLSAVTIALALAAPPGLFDYHVHAHETLSEIGQRGLSPPSAYGDVLRINHLRDPLHLPAGKVLRIPYSLLRFTPILATVEGFRGTVEIDHGKATVGRTLGEGAVVATGADGFARLGLPDGSHIALPSNSRVRIDRLRAIALTGALDRAFTLQGGRAESSVTPMTNPDSRYVIATPVASTAVRGTLFRTEYDPAARRESAGVLHGALAVSGAKVERPVSAGQGVVATPAGVTPPRPLLPAPGLIHGEFPQTEASLRFEISPVPGAARYRLTLANDEAITKTLLERTVDKPEAEAEAEGLPDGSYYVQVSAITPDGLEGEAAVHGFVRLRNSLSGSEVKKTPDGYMFRWTSPGETAPLFHFELHRDGDAGTPVFDAPALKEDHVLVRGLAPGLYKWRVTATRALAGRRAEAWFDPQTLEVAK